jgi:PAS domain S-box-containing protein
MSIPENKEFYAAILDGINTGIWAVDKNENFIFFNSAMERISGLKKRSTVSEIVSECEKVTGNHVLWSNFHNNPKR